MAKYHIGKNGPAPCTATKRACRYGGESTHYTDLKDANAVYEKQLSEEEGGSFGKKLSNDTETTSTDENTVTTDTESTVNNDDTATIETGKDTEADKIRYSFIKDFEEKQKAFEADFGEYPKRFFNADLRGKRMPKNVDLVEVADDLDYAIQRDPSELDDEQRKQQRFLFNILPALREGEIYGNMMHATSQPKENKEMPIDEAEKLAKELGAINVKELTGKEADSLGGVGATRGIIAEFPGGLKKPSVTVDERGRRKFIPRNKRDQYPAEEDRRYVVFTDRPNKQMKVYIPGSERAGLTANDTFIKSDLRSLAGAKRIQENTGNNLLQEITVENRNPGAKYNENKIRSIRRLGQLEEAQLKGKGFLDQEKYVKDRSGKVATAYMDKKNPDKIRQELMEKSTLHVNNGGGFRKVEIDNDVDPEEFKDFENAYNEIKDKLPPIPGDKRPELRVRKLGRHNANGVYFPHKGTLAIDVRTSEAFVHEYGHYLDLTVKNNASLSSDFREISKEYSQKLELNEVEQKKRDYYTTPTEVFSRSFEIYANERLGINNRLLNPAKFKNNDHKPFSDPTLKKKAFDFFDKLFEKNTSQQKAV